MPYEPQHKLQVRNLVLSHNRQTTYGTVLADAALIHRPRMDADAFAAIGKEFFSDIERAGKGHEWGTLLKEVQRSTSFGMGVEATDWLAAWAAANIFNSVATSGVGPYTHVFTWLVSSNQARVTTLYFEDTAAIKYKLQDFAIAQLEFSGAATGPLSMSFQGVGSGRHTDIAMTLPAAVTPAYLLGSDTDILLGPQGAPVSIKERVRGWKVEFVREVAPHFAPGGGLYASFSKVATRRCRVSLQIAAIDTEAAAEPRTLFLNDTVRELQINTNSGAAAQLNIKFPAIRLSSNQAAADGMEEIWQLEADERSIFKDGSNQPVEVTAINNQPTYLAAA